MPVDSQNPVPSWRTYSERTAVLALLVVGSVCAIVWLSGPRPLAPTELPSLHLDAEPVRAAIAADAALAASAQQDPGPSALADALDENFLAQGRADYALLEAMEAHRKRATARHALRDQLVQAEGERALWALRARAAERFEAALRGEVPEAELPAVLGVFPNLLAASGVTRDGRDVAPTFVARVMYKARWNTLLGFPADRALAPIERQALFGWAALHAQNEPIPARLEALRGYAQAGGRAVAEARGVLLFLNGEYGPAVAALETAYGAHPTLRLRNYLAGARLVAQAAQRTPGRRAE